jgi:hypothetical protein
MASSVDVATLVVVCVTLLFAVLLYLAWKDRTYYVELDHAEGRGRNRDGGVDRLVGGVVAASREAAGDTAGT